MAERMVKVVFKGRSLTQLEDLMQESGSRDPGELVTQALRVYTWMLEQNRAGRAVVADVVGSYRPRLPACKGRC